MTIWNKIFIKLCPHTEWKQDGWASIQHDGMGSSGNVYFKCRVCVKRISQEFIGEQHKKIKLYEQKWKKVKI